MRVALESRVMAAALWDGHSRHRVARERVLAESELGASQYAFAETFSSLTSLPCQPPLAPTVVLAVMRDVFQPVRVLGLAPPDHEFCLTMAERLGLSGPILFDLLNARAAANWGAEEILTLDPEGHELFAAELGLRVRAI